jgi:hypothetical protein
MLVTAAVIAATNNGSAWDGDASAPDVLPSFPDVSATWSIKQDTYSPTWSPGEGVVATAAFLTETGVGFQLFDSDVVSNDTITQLVLVKPNDAHFAAGGFTLASFGGAQSVTFSLTKHVSP